MLDEKSLKRIVVVISIAVLVILAVLTIWSILLSIIAGLILAYMFYPVYRWVFNIVREKNISALLIVLLIIFLIFLPIWFLFPVVAKQVFDAYSFTQKVDLFSILKVIIPESLSQDTSVAISTFITNLVSSAMFNLSGSLVNLPDILLQFTVVLFVFFYAMRDAGKLKEYVKHISPFSRELEDNLSKQFKEITKSVIFGHLVVGILQGILTGVGLFIAGVPQALLLTVLAVFFSILPVIGAWLIWIPAAIYLFATGHTAAGVGLFLFGAIVVSWVDNILRPYIVARKTNISSAIVFVGMIGGLIVFGIIGIVLGPLILSYLIIILDAYKDKKLSSFFS